MMTGTKILVVEDDPSIRRLIEYTLEGEGYQVIAVGNGEQALNQIQTEQPGLVILDMVLPDINGPEICERLRASPETAALPVIILTTRQTPVDALTSRQTGIDTYLAKPIDLDALLDRVVAILSPAGSSQRKAKPAILPDRGPKATLSGALADRLSRAARPVTHRRSCTLAVGAGGTRG